MLALGFMTIPFPSLTFGGGGALKEYLAKLLTSRSRLICFSASAVE